MMKYLLRTCVALFALGMCMPIYGVPARPGVTMYRQPDGSMIEVVVRGDEDCHWYETPEGVLLEATRDGRLSVASQGAAERLRERRNAPRAVRAYTDYPTTGRQKALVILVEFADVSFRYSLDDFRSMLTTPGYSYSGAAGSARDYFIENSAGNFIPEFDVYGPVRLSQNMAHYGANDEEFAHEMVVEACRALDGEIDFSEYDRDGNGWVDNIYIFYSGYGEADGGGANSVWPHSANIYNRGARLNLDGVQIGQYACSNELVGNTTRMVGIGTFCHEFSHVLGLPDLYATNNSTGFTPYCYSLMDHGNYNNDGRCPCALTAYERYYLGWCEPTELNANGTVRLDPIDSNMAVRISVPGYPEEYYLLENRQKSGWDAYLPGHGMLIWHIDYRKEYWDNNSVNNDANHMRVDLIEADSRGDYLTIAGDPFPGIYSVSTFSNFTPWLAAKLPHTLSNIKETGETLTFDFNTASTLPAVPGGLALSDFEDTSMKASWNRVAGADAYIINVQAREEGRPRPRAAWTQHRVADGTSAIIAGLEPETEYEVTVQAVAGISTGAPCAAVRGVTAEPGLSYRTPSALAATDIQKTSFTANWESLEGADDYVIDVTTIAMVGSETVAIPFSNPLSLPDGWQTTSGGLMSVSGYYGAEAPSLRMAANAEYLESPIYEAPVESLTFWMRGYRAETSASLQVQGLVEGEWTTLSEIKPIDNNNAQTVTFDAIQLRGAKAIRLRWNNPSGNGSLCIDDVTLGFGLAAQRVYVLQQAEAGSGNSFIVSGLQPGTNYTYVIRGRNGERLSLPSNEIALTTSPETGLQAAGDDSMAVSVEGNTLSITAPGEIRLFTASGICVASATTFLRVALPAGIYFINANSSTKKLIIK